MTHVHQEALALLHFTPPHPSFHYSIPQFPFLPLCTWTNRSRTGDFPPPHPEGWFLNLSLPLCCCLLTLFQSLQKPPSRVRTERHLSREPKAQTTEGSLKEGSKLDARQRKSQGEAAKDDFLKKSYPSIKFDTSMRHASKCKTYTALQMIWDL